MSFNPVYPYTREEALNRGGLESEKWEKSHHENIDCSDYLLDRFVNPRPHTEDDIFDLLNRYGIDRTTLVVASSLLNYPFYTEPNDPVMQWAKNNRGQDSEALSYFYSCCLNPTHLHRFAERYIEITDQYISLQNEI